MKFQEQERTRLEWQVEGTQYTPIRLADRQAVQKILYPSAGTIIAIDPDIPPAVQRVFFESHPQSHDLLWSLDGEIYGSAKRLVPWKPEPGHHILQLVGENGEIRDQVNFSVRGPAGD